MLGTLLIILISVAISIFVMSHIMAYQLKKQEDRMYRIAKLSVIEGFAKDNNPIVNKLYASYGETIDKKR
ncbi:hypothetical protein KAR50_00375 [Periweissella fabaria]|uniref:Uncharacterized protein n=1 Tax=Periweissella fabaria TaxID=546157 RepID=A0ABM8Z3Q1_9LACO|nr:hypothetical protein [Periweissella fabaria]MCM0596316.1 hypothetical protein [Periweissella fabaria]CAH0415928.1 hypothetical protein WFA24289_00226 [Periweissella fabaria]